MSDPATQETAWAYLVVSSEQQADTLDHQQTWAQDLARQNNWTITETFRGVSSGRDGTRGLLEQLLTKLRATPATARPNRVLMIRLDRIGRGLGLEALAAIAEIKRLGSVIHTRQDGDYSLTRASDSILPLMRVVTGAIENEARRDKANAVYARRRAANAVVSNKRPYGLCIVDGKDVAQEPQAQAVRYAFELAANGFGLAAIGGRLRSLAPPKVYGNGRAHQTEWTRDRVGKLLRNKAYAGTLVDQKIWDRVQALRAGATRARVRSKNPWPLGGTLHCTCGRVLIGSITGSSPQRVYRCSSKSIHGRNLSYGAIRLEAAFEQLLSRLQATPGLSEACLERESLTLTAEGLALRSTAVEERLALLGLERRRAWQLNERGMITDAELARRLKEIDTELTQLAADKVTLEDEQRRLDQELANALRAEELLAEASLLWSSADVDRKRSAAQALARALGGLYVDAGELYVGTPPKPQRFIRMASSS